ncbi:hypothetical protein ACLKA6_005761 [Drosophila palustris]
MAPITKRMRENSNGEIKANKGIDMSTILQLINELFKEQADLIDSKMSEFEERILSVLHERLTEDMKKLCERVQQLERDASVVEALKTQAHVRAIFGLEGIEKGSGRSHRQLSDKMNSHLNSIRTLTLTEEILDGFLIYIVVSKLDERTREDILPTTKLPSWNSMKLFLEKRCRSLENWESAMYAFLAASIAEWPKPIEVLRSLPELRVTTLVESAKLDVSINCKYHN